MKPGGNEMSFCTSCGKPLETNAHFCQICGTPVASTHNETPAAAEPAVLFADKVKAEEEAKKQKEAEEAASLAAEARQARIDARKARNQAIKDKIMSNKPLWFPVIGAATLAIAYGATQFVIYSSSGPEAKLTEYVNAIKTANFEALDDETLFPGDFAEAPVEFQNGFDKDAVANATYTTVVRSGMDATASIVLDPSNASAKLIPLQLTAHNEWVGPFQVPVWAVTSEAPSATISVDKKLTSAQTVSFSPTPGVTKENTLKVSALRKLDFVSLLPGVYGSTISKRGYLNQTKSEAVFWPDSSTGLISFKPDESVSAITKTKAAKRANSVAAACVRSRCSKLPRYDEYDFNLWSQYDEDEYTSSSFDYDYSLDSCSLNSTEVTNSTSATLTYLCGVTVDAHLYVKWVYYYGYYSDYWYYWNFYDDTTTSMTVTVKVSTNASGTKVTIKSAK